MTPEEQAEILREWTEANKKLQPHGDEYFVDQDPWVQEKYRRGGEKELEEYIRRTPRKILEEDSGDPGKTPEEVMDALKKTSPGKFIVGKDGMKFWNEETKAFDKPLLLVPDSPDDVKPSVGVDCAGCGKEKDVGDLNDDGFCLSCENENNYAADTQYGDCGKCGATDEKGHATSGDDTHHHFLCDSCYESTGTKAQEQKKVTDFTKLNGKIGPAFAYRAYKNSPHHPVSLFLKYSINRIENKEFYAKATPEEISQHEKEWMEHHQQGKAATKNGHITLAKLHRARELNPTFEASIRRLQTRVHNYVKTHSPWLLKEIDGEPHVALARGYTLDKGKEPAADHDLCSYADDIHRTSSFGNVRKTWWIPLKKVYYSYDIGHSSSSSSDFGPEDEWLTYHHKRIPADDKDVARLVPRSRFGFKPVNEEWKWNPKNHLLTPEELTGSASFRTVAILHPNLPVSVLEKTLFDPSTPRSIVYAGLKSPNITKELLSKFLSKSRDTIGLVLRRPDILGDAEIPWQPEHFEQVVKTAAENPRTTSPEHVKVHVGSHPNSPQEYKVHRYATGYDAISAAPKELIDPLMDSLIRNRNISGLVDLTHNDNLSPEHIQKLEKIWEMHPRDPEHEGLLRGLSKKTSNTEFARKVLDRISERSTFYYVDTGAVARNLAVNPNLAPEFLAKINDEWFNGNGPGLAHNPKFPKDILRQILGSETSSEAQVVSAGKNLQITHEDLGVLQGNRNVDSLPYFWSKLSNDQKDFCFASSDPTVVHRAISMAAQLDAIEDMERGIQMIADPLLRSQLQDRIYRYHSTTKANSPTTFVESAYSRKKRRELGWDGGLAKSEDPDWFEGLMSVGDPVERRLTLKSKHITPFHLRQAMNDEDPDIRIAAVHHPAMTPELLREIIAGDDTWLAEAALSRHDLRPEDLEPALKDPDLRVTALRHPACTPEQKKAALTEGLPEGLAQEVDDSLVKNIGTLTFPHLGEPRVSAVMAERAHVGLLDRLKARHGAGVTEAISAALLSRLSEDQRLQVQKIHDALSGPHLSLAAESQLSALHRYLQSPDHRTRAHVRLRIINNDAAQQSLVAGAHKAWRGLRSAAQNILPEDVGIDHRNVKDRIHDWTHALKKSRTLSESVSDQLGFNVELHTYVKAAQFLTRQTPNYEDIRRALFEAHGDILAAVCKVFDLKPEAILGVASLETIQKSERTPEIKALMASGEDIERALRWAYANNQVEPIKLGGKHSSGSMMAKDADGNTLLLKPGFGKNSPAAGVREEPASQSRREGCFYALADLLGLKQYVPRAEVISIDGKEIAVMEMLGMDWQGIFRHKENDPNKPRLLLRPYLERGIVHRWAVLDYVGGNPDRHANNVLVGPERDGNPVSLIDAGSAFAGKDFSPGRDQNSFVPYYLRAFGPDDWNKLDTEKRAESLPRLPVGRDQDLRNWILGIDPEAVQKVLLRFGINPGASVARLEALRTAVQTAPEVLASEIVNGFWTL